ncbi:hypothetical protein OPQ81_010395 [Rhizoctonia solani]|nr:hypothetical protein OPQ81_010395 [Rhizoctonia solani]
MLLSVISIVSGLFALLVFRRYRKQQLLVPLPGPPPTSYLTGHFKDMFGLHGLEFQGKVLETYGPTVRMTGVMGLPIFTNVAKQACEAIDKALLTEVIDVFPWTTAAALELIGEAGLGYSFNSFSGERNEYSVAIRSVAQLLTKLVPFIPIYPYLVRLPVTPSLLSCALFPLLRQVLRSRSLQNEQAEQILRTRQDMLASGADLESVTGRGKDILTQLMRANEEGLDRDAMIGHMNILIFAGHETTSSAMARILEILSNNQEIQEKLRNEVLQCREEDVLELPYLDAVVKETLRLYPPASYLGRVCEEDTVVPLDYPISTPYGVVASLPIKRGTRLALSVIFSNRDEKIWGNRAGEFWPERWLQSEQPGNSSLQSMNSSIMTFGIGKYACIGLNFAVMEIKAMTAQLLKSFKFETSGEEYAWEVQGVQNPYLTKERGNPTRVPKLPLRVSRFQ